VTAERILPRELKSLGGRINLSDAGSTIYVVDPDSAITEAIATLLGTYGLSVRTFPDAEAFLAFSAHGNVQDGCVMLEVNLPGLSGLALLRQLRAEGMNLPIIILTNAHEPAMHRQAVRFGADRVVEKPLINDTLTYTVTTVLHEYRRHELQFGVL